MSLSKVGNALEDPGFHPRGLVADLIAETRRRLRMVERAEPEAWEDILEGLLRNRAALTAGSTHGALATILAELASTSIRTALRAGLENPDVQVRQEDALALGEQRMAMMWKDPWGRCRPSWALMIRLPAPGSPRRWRGFPPR